MQYDWRKGGNGPQGARVLLDGVEIQDVRSCETGDKGWLVRHLRDEKGRLRQVRLGRYDYVVATEHLKGKVEVLV